MKKALTIKNYVIQIADKDTATHIWHELPEDLCKELAEVTDQGEQFSTSSRFVYSCNGVSLHKDTFQFGTAKAAVQAAVSKYFGQGFNFLNIIKTV